VIETLRDAPTLAISRPPVELVIAAGGGDCSASAIRIIYIVKDALKFGWESHLDILSRIGTWATGV
jgi:hypothetical protein